MRACIALWARKGSNCCLVLYGCCGCVAGHAHNCAGPQSGTSRMQVPPLAGGRQHSGDARDLRPRLPRRHAAHGRRHLRAARLRGGPLPPTAHGHLRTAQHAHFRPGVLPCSFVSSPMRPAVLVAEHVAGCNCCVVCVPLSDGGTLRCCGLPISSPHVTALASAAAAGFDHAAIHRNFLTRSCTCTRRSCCSRSGCSSRRPSSLFTVAQCRTPPSASGRPCPCRRALHSQSTNHLKLQSPADYMHESHLRAVSPAAADCAAELAATSLQATALRHETGLFCPCLRLWWPCCRSSACRLAARVRQTLTQPPYPNLGS